MVSPTQSNPATMNEEQLCAALRRLSESTTVTYQLIGDRKIRRGAPMNGGLSFAVEPIVDALVKRCGYQVVNS